MAKDVFHYTVKTALQKEGWIVTNDPLIIEKKALGARLEIDMGLERILVAEKDTERIAVEVKSFLKPSLVNELHDVFGQYFLYLIGLEKIQSDRDLYLAIPENIYDTLIKMELFLIARERMKMKLILFDPFTETIVAWKK